jgi:hypothetical protein
VSETERDLASVKRDLMCQKRLDVPKETYDIVLKETNVIFIFPPQLLQKYRTFAGLTLSNLVIELVYLLIDGDNSVLYHKVHWDYFRPGQS